MSRRLIVISGTLTSVLLAFVFGCDLKDFDGLEEQSAKSVSLSVDQVSVSEADAGSGVQYNVGLGATPDDTVMILIASAEDRVTVDPDTLIFLASATKTSIGVTVNAIDNDLDDDGTSPQDSLTHEIVTRDAVYDTIDVATIPVFVTDDDVSGLDIPSSLALPENYTVQLDVSLTCQPRSDVMLELSVSDPGEDIAFLPPGVHGTTDKAYDFTFTENDWNEPQGVNVIWGGDPMGDDVTLDFEADSDDENYDSGGEVFSSISVSGVTIPFWTLRLASGQSQDVDEGEAGSPGSFSVVVELSEGSGSVSLATVAGTAASGDDFVAYDDVIHITEGTQEQEVTIDCVGDGVFEDLEESFSLELSGESLGTLIADGQLDLTVIDDEEVTVVVENADSVVEGEVAEFSVTTTLPPAQRDIDVSFRYTTVTGGPFSSDVGDIEAATNALFTVDSDVETDMITVQTNVDPDGGDDETFGLSFFSADDRIVAPGGFATGAIEDTTAFALAEFSDVVVYEGDDGGPGEAVFTVRTSVAYGQPWSLGVSTTAGSAEHGSDFIHLTSGEEIDFADDETEGTVTVNIVWDEIAEAEQETFSVELDLTGTGLQPSAVDATAHCVIIDDDLPCLAIEAIDPVTIGYVGFYEGEPAAYRVLVLDGDGDDLDEHAPISGAVEIALQAPPTLDAAAEEDFDPWTSSFPFTIDPGSHTSGDITIATILDPQESHEYYTVSIAPDPENADLTDCAGTSHFAGIWNRPQAAVLSEHATEPTAIEEGETCTFVVRLNEALVDESWTFQYTTQDGTAEAGTDYVAAGGSRTFQPGADTLRIDVEVLADGELDDDFYETFSLQISSVDPLVELGDADAECYIEDADGIKASLSGPQLFGEEDGDQTYTVTLSASTQDDVTVGIQDLSGSGNDPIEVDDVSIIGDLTHTFTGGDTEWEILVSPAADTNVEHPETFLIALDAGAFINAAPDPTADQIEVTIGDDTVVDESNLDFQDDVDGALEGTELLYPVMISDRILERPVELLVWWAYDPPLTAADLHPGESIPKTVEIQSAMGDSVRILTAVNGGSEGPETLELFIIEIDGEATATPPTASGDILDAD